MHITPRHVVGQVDEKSRRLARTSRTRHRALAVAVAGAIGACVPLMSAHADSLLVSWNATRTLSTGYSVADDVQMYLPQFNSSWGTLTSVEDLYSLSASGAWVRVLPEPYPFSLVHVHVYAELDNGTSQSSPSIVWGYDEVNPDPTENVGLLGWGPFTQGGTLTGSNVNNFYGTSFFPYTLYHDVQARHPDAGYWFGSISALAQLTYNFTPGSTPPTLSIGSTNSSLTQVYSFSGGTLSGSTLNLTGGGVMSASAGTLTMSNRTTVAAGAGFLQTGGVVSLGTYINNGTVSHLGGTVTMASVSGTGNMTLDGGVKVNNSGAFAQGTLTLNGNASLTSTGATRQTSGVALDIGTLVVNSTSSSFDIANHDLIIRDGATLSDVKSMVISGWNGGAWNGHGITTSSATSSPDYLRLGYDVAGSRTTFDGISIASDDILVKFTYAADANLDGKVDTFDLGVLSSHWGWGVSPDTHQPTWADGDWNYDGKVDSFDSNLLSVNWQKGVSSGLMLVEAEFHPPGGEGPASVPEPASLAVLTLGAASLAARPRRKR